VAVLLRGDSNALQMPAGARGLLKRRVLENLFAKCSGFFAAGSTGVDFYRTYGAPQARIFLNPYCVDNDFFFSEADKLAGQKIELKQKLGLPPDLPLIVFCGRLSNIKRPMDLLQAYERATRKHPAALAYVGDGELRPQLENYIRERGLAHAHLLGFRNQSQLPSVFAAADVFVLPSSFEPWGLVVNEAMCFGLSVIASNKVGAARDLVRPGENGFVFPACDVGALAQALESLLGDADLRARMGAASRRLVRTWSYREATEGVVRYLHWLAENEEQAG
jgi:glycosyltransferase involved in cell wall biosynthesis